MNNVSERIGCNDSRVQPDRERRLAPPTRGEGFVETSPVSRLLRMLIFAGAGVSVVAGQIADATQATAAANPGQHATASAYRTTAMTDKARSHYQIFWGIDSLEVKAVESGEMIRFSYFVLDPVKATQLNDKKANPTLVDQEARVTLAIPSVEQVGQLRQSGTPVAGKAYWMVFANKRREVKRGDRVSIVIGKFRADGLYVQ